MRRVAFILVLCALVLCSQGIAFSQQAVMDIDPLRRNLIFVEGESDKEFAVNMFRLSFGFDIQKASFSETNTQSEQIAKRIEASVKGLGLSGVKIIKGWDIIKQAKISVGATGSKLSNQLIIEVRDFPEGKMQELIAKIIDLSLAIDKEVFLEKVESGVTEDVEDKCKEEVLTEALKQLKINADSTAGTQGKKVTAVKRVFVITDQQAAAEVNQYGYDSYEPRAKSPMMLSRSFVSVQKGFNVSSNITDHVKVYSKVAGVYEID